MEKYTLEPYIRNLEDRTTLEEIKKDYPLEIAENFFVNEKGNAATFIVDFKCLKDPRYSTFMNENGQGEAALSFFPYIGDDAIKVYEFLKKKVDELADYNGDNAQNKYEFEAMTKGRKLPYKFFIDLVFIFENEFLVWPDFEFMFRIFNNYFDLDVKDTIYIPIKTYKEICPICGHESITGEPYDICPVCRLENAFPDLNNRYSECVGINEWDVVREREYYLKINLLQPNYRWLYSYSYNEPKININPDQPWEILKRHLYLQDFNEDKKIALQYCPKELKNNLKQEIKLIKKNKWELYFIVLKELFDDLNRIKDKQKVLSLKGNLSNSLYLRAATNYEFKNDACPLDNNPILEIEAPFIYDGIALEEWTADDCLRFALRLHAVSLVVTKEFKLKKAKGRYRKLFVSSEQDNIDAKGIIEAINHNQPIPNPNNYLLVIFSYKEVLPVPKDD